MLSLFLEKAKNSGGFNRVLPWSYGCVLVGPMCWIIWLHYNIEMPYIDEIWGCISITDHGLIGELEFYEQMGRPVCGAWWFACEYDGFF
jgi:hypothetical protein